MPSRYVAILAFICTVAYTLSRSECFSWQRRQRHLQIGGILGEESLKGLIILSSNYQSIFSSNQYYTHMKVEKEEQKTQDGSRSGIRLGPETLGFDMIKDWNGPREKDEKEVVGVG